MFSNSNTAVNSHNEAQAKFLKSVFNYMSGGVAISGLAAYITLHTSLINLVLTGGFQFGFLLVWFGFGFFCNKIVDKLSVTSGLLAFIFFSAITGMALAPTILIYTQASVATAFFVASGTFVGMSLFGINSKKSLSGWGTFLNMAWIGILVAIVVNIILAIFGVSTQGFGLFLSFLIVPLVSATVAYEVNTLKEVFYQYSGESRQKLAIMGAISLYTSFVILFIHLLRILGVANND